MKHHQVLARKWRPRSFAEVVGQQHILKTLTHAFEQARLHHAYLFSGTRGVGKTTLARILAKCLNCEQGVTATPCGHCSTCLTIDAGRYLDLIEIDAASRTKVEDTRDLLESVPYAPHSGRYKVYLIDEIHMLSGHSFNALLKTLEEPPAHVKFLFATTDPQKLPVTILSRCIQFHLKNLAPEQISPHLQHILKQENIHFETKALPLLAQAAQGSMRDALSLLDQAISYGGGTITYVDVAAMLGTIDPYQLSQLFDALAKNDAIELLAVSAQLAELGSDFNQVLEEILSWLHKIALTQALRQKNVGNLGNEDTHEDIEKQQLIGLAEKFTREAIQLFYQIALIGRRDLTLAPSLRIGFEMILLRMLAFAPVEPVTKDLQNQEIPHAVKNDGKCSQVLQQSRKSISEEYVSQDWATLLSHLKLNGISQTLAEHCCLDKITPTSIHLILDPGHATWLKEIHVKRIETALTEYFSHPLQLFITISPTTLINAPARQRQLVAEHQSQERVKIINDDPIVKRIIENFNGTLINDSITLEENIYDDKH